MSLVETGSRREWALLSILALAGLALFAWKADSVFPEAAVRLKLSRGEIVRKGRAFCVEQGVDLAHRRQAVGFAENDDGVAYLQKLMPLGRVQELADPDREAFIPLWFWHLRWFNPLDKEEAWVSFAPNGKLTSFHHVDREEDPGSLIPRDKAKPIALACLRKNLRFRDADWTLVEESSEDKPKRRDHYFTWKRKEPTFGEAHLRAYAGIHGDRVASFKYFLNVPEKFSRDYSTQRSRGLLVTTMMWSVCYLFFMAAAVLFVLHFRTGLSDARMGLLFAALYFLSKTIEIPNGWPGQLLDYQTTDPFWAFVYNNFLYPLIYDLPLQGLIAMTVGVGVGLALLVQRRSWLDGVRELSIGRIGHSSWPKAVFRGYLLAVAFLGFQAVIYFLGWRYLGVWFPGRNYLGSILSNWLPALSPITAALYAAPFEEGIFRLAAFVLVLRWTKRPWIAVLVPSAVDAFLHSAYEVFPWYFRGIELTLLFSLFAFCFHRWGLMTIMIAHGLMDIIWTALPLLKSGQSGWTLQGFAAVGAPLALAGLGWAAQRRASVLEPEIPALNRDVCVEMLRGALSKDGWPRLEELLLAHGAHELKPVERAVFVLRELLGETVELRKAEGKLILLVQGSADTSLRALGMRLGERLLSAPASARATGYSFEIPA